MDIFDECIREVKEWFRQKMEGGNVRQWEMPTEVERSSSAPDETSQGSSIILKEDTHLELGHPSVGSCSATLATHDTSLVNDRRLTLVGPDIGETTLDKVPFAQIAIASCEDNIEDACSIIDRTLHAAAQTNGYMLRSVPDLIWARVSKDAARSGFSLGDLGHRLLSSLHHESNGLGKSEIFFVTSSREDVLELNEIVGPTRSQLRKLQAFGRTEDGTYECDSSLDCNECPEEEVCGTIRDVIKIRKGDRIITLGDEDNAE